MKKLLVSILITVLAFSTLNLVFAERVNEDDVPRGYIITVLKDV